MKPEQLRNRILAADLAWIPGALVAEQALCSGFGCRQVPLSESNFVVYVVATVFAWILLSENMHLDGFRAGWRPSALISHLLLATALLMLLLLAVETVSDRYIGRLTLSVFSLFLFLGFVCIRGFALRTVLRRYHNGEFRHIVILGGDRLASELAVKFNHHPELLCKVVGFLSPGAETPAVVPRRDSAAAPATVPTTVSTMDVVALLRRHNVEELVLARPPASTEVLNLVALCRQQSIRVSLVPQPYELYLSRPRLVDLGGLPWLQLEEIVPPASARIGKRLLDVGLGGVLAAATLPIVLVCAAALRVSAGRAFRWELRTGWRGTQFSMLRLNVDRNPQNGSAFKRFLSQSSISELPQFWNVFRGEMSLVGPRPEGPERALRYSAWQQQRLSIKPGMTGLAQVHGLREQHPSEDKARHDLQYMLRPSLLKDLSLLIETIWTLALRLINLSTRPPSTGTGPDEATLEVAAAPQSILYSAATQPFPEMLQHAHRTQSGSD
jgi:lipopolysaccharide/colanic/teichoic acid biosynthesis glycosyltransferase